MTLFDYNCWKIKDRLRRHAGMNLEKAISFYEEGSLSREDLASLAHEHCIGIPINSASFLEKMELALSIRVISIEEHASKMREYYLNRSAREFELGYEEGFLCEDEGKLKVDPAELFYGEKPFLDDDFIFRHLDRINYANRRTSDIRWKAYSLFLAAKCEGLYDRDPESEENGRLAFERESSLNVLRRLSKKDFILPEHLQRILKGQESHVDWVTSMYVGDYYSEFLSWLYFKQPKIYDKYVKWVKNHKEKYSRRFEENKTGDESQPFDPYFDPFT
jgi:hypothetical protein